MQRNGTNVDTHYVYNDLQQLCYVLPALAADALDNGTYTEATDAVKKYGYVYKYDSRGNCIYKKLPGCEPILMAYDKADRLVLSQDGNQRQKSPAQWTITKYDVFGRVILTGTSNTISSSHTALITLYKDDLVVETYANGAYTNNKFSDAAPLTINYYDDYDFITDTQLDYEEKQGYSARYTPPSGGGGVKGLLTSTRTYLLDGSGNYTTSVNYYDDKARVVQTRSTNHLGGYDIVYNDLDFTGKPNKTLKEHNIAINGVQQSAVSELYTYEYDHAQRLLKTKYQINNKPEVILTDMTNGGYDELGRLKTKKRHNGTDTESFQYNIRNWTTKITSGTFEENLFYNTKPSNIEQATPCYNGNICYSTWTYNGGTRGYEYEYDELNRYTGGYAYNNNEMLVDYQYSEWFNYNKMGNITHLLRYGDGGEFYDLDNLSFTYNGNQLIKVDDENSYNIYNVKEYQNKVNQENEMAYDANGNLIKDLDRDIYTIRYNLLNLPDIVQFKNGNQIRNLYDAGGQKLETRYVTLLTPLSVPLVANDILQDIDVTEAEDVTITGTSYVGNFEYGLSRTFDYDVTNTPIDNRWLDKVYNAEGYSTGATYQTWGPIYNYFRKDHLGNNREVWRAAFNKGSIRYIATTLQRTQYYPSGLPWAESTGQAEQNKKYNGKEFVEAHGLDETDLGNRGLYHATDRFTSIDRFCEKYPWQSPYVFAANNPILNVDIRGDSAWSVKRDWNESDVKNFATYSEQKLKEYEGQDIDCADLSLSVLIDYASENGLELQIATADGKTFDSNSDDYNSIDDYKYGSKDEKGNRIYSTGVLPGVKSTDIPANTFTLDKSNAQSGDIMILTQPHNHIINISQTNPIQLTYGNIGAPVKTTSDWTKYSDKNSGGTTYTDSRGVVYKYKPNNKIVHRWNYLNF